MKTFIDYIEKVLKLLFYIMETRIPQQNTWLSIIAEYSIVKIQNHCITEPKKFYLQKKKDIITPLKKKKNELKFILSILCVCVHKVSNKIVIFYVFAIIKFNRLYYISM